MAFFSSDVNRLVGEIAHEINNPLFVISGRLEMLLGRKSLPRPLRKELEVINEQADRIRKSVERMLKLARGMNGKMEGKDVL